MGCLHKAAVALEVDSNEDGEISNGLHREAGLLQQRCHLRAEQMVQYQTILEQWIIMLKLGLSPRTSMVVEYKAQQHCSPVS